MNVSTSRHAWITVAAVVFCIPVTVFAQSTRAFTDNVGYLNVRSERVRWAQPESVVSDLRSADDQIRLKALSLLGLSDKQSHHTVWAQSSPTKPAGSAVIVPDKIQLTYAALGADATQDAIVAVEDVAGQMTYAAVAVPRRDGWEQFALFQCWCKYEMLGGQDALDEFVQLRPAPQRGPTTPQHYELVLRASGGGTGVYTQNEAHYRLFHGQLRRVLAFVSSHRQYPPEQQCNVEKRTFRLTEIEGSAGGELISTRFTAFGESAMHVASSQNHQLGRATCRMYRWNEQSFRYMPFGNIEPCE